MSKEDENKAPREVKPEVTRIAEFIKDKLKLDSETGDITQVGEGSLYEQSLPEDLTMKTVKKVHGHDKNFIAGVSKVVGDMSLKAFVDDKDLKQTELSLPTDGHSSIDVRCARKKDYVDRISNKDNNGSNDNLPTVSKFCNLSVKVKTSLGGDFNIVKRDLLERGKEALSS